ncbi:glycosyltransferase family 39 protein [Pedobacter rhodius]|uniref:Glycosyltransferase family 39 protein n=1 Tax=Pedobacter rhodius TaxID=3004098 RepID=A0ABT4KVX0_9SPHI|nr:glycosyltransferase family 39 protein [Pedobacter sp. SJ11]MCZ4222989.1 glycosyltransferase family 39 protein [Pedobacter sp. SJ11]
MPFLLKSALKDKFSYYLFLSIIVLGVFLRLYHYFINRSLWLDEGYLTSSLLNFNFQQLVTKPLDYQQKAPIGFLLIVKLFLNIFGYNEYGLRIVPLLSGLLSILIFIPVTKYFLKSTGILVAVAILCISPAFVYHSVEIKQYSTELLCSILSFYLFIKYRTQNGFKEIIIWSLGGGIILWFSFSAIFILGGISLGLSVYYLITKQWNILFRSFIPFITWLVSFILLFVFFINKTPDAEWVINWFRFYGDFMPLPPKSVSDLSWFFKSFYRMLDYPMGLLWDFFESGTQTHSYVPFIKMPFLPFIFLGAGIYFCFKKSLQNFNVLVFPLLLVLLASGLELYPLTERFWLFLTPILMIFIGMGLDCLIKRKPLKIIIVILLLISPVIQSFQSIRNSAAFYKHKKSYQKESFDMINKEFKAGDAVYVYWNELPGFKVYSNLKKYKFNAIEGQDFRWNSANLADYNTNLSSDFKKFKNNKRVWVIFNNKFLSNVGDPISMPKWYYENKNLPAANLKTELSKIGKFIKTSNTADVSVYLYKITNQPNKINP